MCRCFKIIPILCASLFLLSGCGDKIIEIDSDVYSKIEKEDKKFEKAEELNEESVEYTNKTGLGNVKTKDIITQNVEENTTSSNKIAPKDIDSATIEEEYDCDIISIDGINYFVPLANGFNIANSSDIFSIEHMDGMTTLTTNDANKTIIKIYMVKKDSLEESFFLDYLNNKFNDFSTKNTISNLKLTSKLEVENSEIPIYYQSLSWKSVENATITFNENAICWMEYKDYYVYAEYYSYNEEETINIENVANDVFCNFIYINDGSVEVLDTNVTEKE